MTKDKEFMPNWVSAPGATIADILEDRRLSQLELARRLGSSSDEVAKLIRGAVEITIETARQLETILGPSTKFWITREKHYREGLVLQTSFESQSTWLKALPIRDMIKFGWLELPAKLNDQVKACLSFFDVPDIATWREKYQDALELAAFRTSPSFESQPGAVAAWLRQGELEGLKIECQQWDSERFKQMLPELRKLTRQKDPNVFLPGPL